MSEAVVHADFEAWLAAESTSERRHEFAAGARAAGWRPFMGNRIVRTPSANSYYPDVILACGRAPHRLYETDPSLVIEVLSPSTADVDRREKATAFASIPGLTTLLLVDPDVRRIESARTADGRVAGWETFGPGDSIRTPYGDIDLDSLYDRIDATATT